MGWFDEINKGLDAVVHTIDNASGGQITKAAESLAKEAESKMSQQDKQDIANGKMSIGEVVTRNELQENLDIGKAPNVIPSDAPRYDMPPREVVISSHPVVAGAYTQALKRYSGDLDEVPDPAYHWAVVVGNYWHELSAGPGKSGDGELNSLINCYQNGQVGSTKWKGYSWSKFFVVSTTRYNDEAIRQAGEEVMANKMKSRFYNLLDNNCQCFAGKLIDVISDPSAPRQNAMSITYALGPNGLDILDREIVLKKSEPAAENAASIMKQETPMAKA
ncbi:hypothetical protein G7054_g8986 [Neopestalotiopsis clavispora]|nr:hypothetical protein G7054_g8986 [Neopestalotiopsis clavispora]